MQSGQTISDVGKEINKDASTGMQVFVNMYDQIVNFVNSKLSARSIDFEFTRLSFGAAAVAVILLLIVGVNMISNIQLKRGITLVLVLGFVFAFCAMLFKMTILF